MGENHLRSSSHHRRLHRSIPHHLVDDVLEIELSLILDGERALLPLVHQHSAKVDVAGREDLVLTEYGAHAQLDRYAGYGLTTV